MDGQVKTIIIFGIIAVIFLAIQLLLCFKVKRMPIKLIPMYIFILLLLLAILIYTDVFGSAMYNAHHIIAFLLAIGVGSAFVGDVIAWAAYGVYKRVRTAPELSITCLEGKEPGEGDPDKDI